SRRRAAIWRSPICASRAGRSPRSPSLSASPTSAASRAPFDAGLASRRASMPPGRNPPPMTSDASSEHGDRRISGDGVRDGVGLEGTVRADVDPSAEIPLRNPMREGGLEPVCGPETTEEITQVAGRNGRLPAGIVPLRDNAEDTARALDPLALPA